ncbi:MAG: DUF2752 domain-containing protein [Thermoanaerobaculia bacterium]
MKLSRVLSLGAFAAAGAWVLYNFAPTAYRFYPPCIFRLVTGFDCPGCGTTRALHHLLHGRIEEAFRYNPMLFALIAVAMFALPSLVRGRQPRFLTQPWFAWGAFIVLAGYWIVRNTPLYPF